MEPGLARRAAAQGGVFSRRQALAAGYTDGRIARLLAKRAWVSTIPGIYRVTGTPTTLVSRGWAVVLRAGDGALLSHLVAGRLHRIDGVPGYSSLDVSVPRSRRPREVPGARVHRVDLTRADGARAGGLPVTTPLRTVVDLARVLEVDTSARIIADALRTGAVMLDRLDEAIGSLKRRHGADRARAAYMRADPRLESVLEDDLLALVQGLGLPAVAQYEIFQNGRFIARADLAIPELRLAIEADGYGTHALRPGFERDHERLALLQAAGWTLLAFTATQIRERPNWVRDVIMRTARRLLSAQACAGQFR